MATTKGEKSQLLNAVIDQVRNGKPQGKFIKRDTKTKRWYDIGDALAKEKISQSFRDGLVDLYKSSNGFKKKRRCEMKLAKTMRSTKQARHQVPSDCEKQNYYLPETTPSSSSLGSFTTDANAFANLPHFTSIGKETFEPFPINDLNMLRERHLSNVEKADPYMGGDDMRFCNNGIESLDELEEIDITGLMPSYIDSTIEISGRISTRTCTNITPATKVCSAKTA